MRLLLWGLLALMLMPSTSYSAEQNLPIYAPGTIGYLYEDCKISFKKDTTDEFFTTYCGGFFEGLIAGSFVSNYILLLEPSDSDPCANDKKIANDIINSRFCLKGGIYSSHSNNKRKARINFLSETFKLFSMWLEYNGRYRDPSEIMNADIIADFMTFATDTDFCAYLEENEPEYNPIEINQTLLETDWSKAFFDDSKRKWIDTYNQCQTDILSSNNNSAGFKRTRCGAEITGYLTGLNSTSHLQSRRPDSSPSCRSEISALFDEIDVMRRSCVTDRTDPLYIAKIFIKTTESAIAGKCHNAGEQHYPKNSDFLYTTSVTGFAGYLPIWYGEVCKEQQTSPAMNFNR